MPSEKIRIEPLEPIRENWFQHFIQRRTFLIESYEQGKIDKKEFLLMNINDLHTRNMKPFLIIDKMEKAIFNYQYYNAMAKHYLMLAKEVKFNKKEKRKYCNYLSLADKYYNLKDQTILNTLEFTRFKDIDAYFIRCKSKELENKLFEIVFINESQVIFHSKSKEILQILINNSVFSQHIRTSLIESYINDKY